MTGEVTDNAVITIRVMRRCEYKKLLMNWEWIKRKTKLVRATGEMVLW